MALNLKDLMRRIDRVIDSATSSSTLNKVGKAAVVSIKTRTRGGKGVSQNEGREENLKALKASTIRRRQNLKNRGQLSSLTTPRRSNLTRFGQMLSSLAFRVSNAAVEVFLNNQAANKKAKDQQRQGREFMNLSAKEVEALGKVVAKQIEDQIKRQGL